VAAEPSEMPLKPVQHLIHSRMLNVTVLDAQQSVRIALRESDVAVATANREARVIAVFPGIHHPNRWTGERLGVFEAADAAKLIDNQLALHP
jgi:hypothetical protein